MWSWLDHLQLPVLRDQEIIVLKNSAEKNKHNVTIYKWDELDRVNKIEKNKKEFIYLN